MEYAELQVDASGIDETVPKCDVEIVERDGRFSSIDEVQHGFRADFATWWPQVARAVVRGCYAGIESRQAAVIALRPLFDAFPPVEGSQPHAERGDATEELLAELYSTRLLFEEQHLRLIKQAWCNSISRVVRDGESIIRKWSRQKSLLHDKAQSLLNASSDAEAASIIRDELQKAERNIARECDMELRLARAEASVVDAAKKNDTHALEERIASTSRLVAPSKRSRIEKTHVLGRRRIVQMLVAEIRGECDQTWIKALK